MLSCFFFLRVWEHCDAVSSPLLMLPEADTGDSKSGGGGGEAVPQYLTAWMSEELGDSGGRRPLFMVRACKIFGDMKYFRLHLEVISISFYIISLPNKIKIAIFKD